MQDRWAAVACLGLVVTAFVSVFDRFSLGSGLALVALLVMPFGILLTIMVRGGGTRTDRGWDRPSSPGPPSPPPDES
jgi:hypothetical protein